MRTAYRDLDEIRVAQKHHFNLDRANDFGHTCFSDGSIRDIGSIW